MDRRVAENEVAFVKGVEPLIVAAEHDIDDFLPVHRMLDADADISVVQQRFGDVEIEAAREFWVAIVEGDPLDVALVDGLDLGFFIPEIRAS